MSGEGGPRASAQPLPSRDEDAAIHLPHCVEEDFEAMREAATTKRAGAVKQAGSASSRSRVSFTARSCASRSTCS